MYIFNIVNVDIKNDRGLHLMTNVHEFVVKLVYKSGSLIWYFLLNSSKLLNNIAYTTGPEYRSMKL